MPTFSRSVDVSPLTAIVDLDHPTPAVGLTRDERSALTDQLLRRAADVLNEAERERLLAEVIEINHRVARAVAARYRGRGVDLEDLEQAACEGLVKAVQRFDPESGHDLLSYAVPTIRGEVLRFFRDRSWSIRPPRRIQEMQWRINQSIDHLSLELGREPTPQELCEHLDIDRNEYAEVVTSFGCFTPPSLDQPVDGNEHSSLGDAVADARDPREAAEARVVLGPALTELSERDRTVLYLRFYEERTQQQIGDQFGVPQMQVSRWLSRILRDLRGQIGDLQSVDPVPA
ncbi:sigma-70 family RNA polymerase sigma factor [Nocardioides sp. R-C-SC26]|uniref:sigma-70 family RNA polymerase sigma factor n=1 Tax=Nocardioides sp. R-C-SC26 TaxID=2870414 RepID=UPI001E4F7D01|nr:sigma-70 family RNA polymerase sigma factor [Nocardioides sp. R-C-SC26]